jgi:DNA-binding MarR family transcriptional regulator
MLAPVHAATTTASVDELAQELGRFIRVLAPLSGDALEAVAELELSLSQVRALMVLDRHGAMTVGALAARVGLSQPATSRAVDALQRSGLVTRAEDAADRRVRQVAIAAPGRTFTARIQAYKLDALRAFAAGLSEEERARLHEAVAPILADRSETR